MLTGNRLRRTASRLGEAAFTLVEFMVAAGASSLILIALVLGSVSLQRSYRGGDQYANAQNSQLRVMDYLTRDLRRAQSVSVTPDGKQVSVTVPDFYDVYDSNGNPSTKPGVNSQPRDFNVSTGIYGANPLTITYYVDVTTSSLIRQVNWVASGGAAQQSNTTIADGVQSFQLGFVNYGSIVQATITFAPVLQSTNTTLARAGTTLSAAVTLREVPL